jgi:hypothetical protein
LTVQVAQNNFCLGDPGGERVTNFLRNQQGAVGRPNGREALPRYEARRLSTRDQGRHRQRLSETYAVDACAKRSGVDGNQNARWSDREDRALEASGPPWLLIA